MLSINILVRFQNIFLGQQVHQDKYHKPTHQESQKAFGLNGQNFSQQQFLYN